MKKAGYIFGIVIGCCMLGMWGKLLFTGQVKEIVTEPLRIAAHLFSEGITSVLLILGGLLALNHSIRGERLHLVSLGMLLYSVLTGGGYYLQLGNMAMTIMFGAFFVTTNVFILSNLHKVK